MHDLLIRDALLLDGTGSPPARGDLGISNGKILEVGKARESYKQTLNADGLALMPGIIDNHTHYDAQLTWDPLATPSSSLGVTTAVIGNCGFTIAPCRPADRDLILKNLTQVEGMSIEVLRAGTRWDFESVPEFFGMLERQGVALNVAGFVGHSSVRTYVMGEEAPRRAGDRRRGRENAGPGAGRHARRGRGLRHLHLAQPQRPWRQADALARRRRPRTAHAGRLPEGSRPRRVHAHQGRPDQSGVSRGTRRGHRPAGGGRALLHNNTNPRGVFDDLAEISAANGRGRRMLGAISCCPLTMDFTLHSPYTFEGLAAWKPGAFSFRRTNTEAKLKDSAFRRAVRDEINGAPVATRLFNGEWDKVYVENVGRPQNRQWQQQTVAEMAGATAPTRWTRCSISPLPRTWTPNSARCCSTPTETAVGEMLRHPHSLVSLSDAGAHLTLFNDAGFGLHLLGHWVRELGALKLKKRYRKSPPTPRRYSAFPDAAC
jgi:N-acyl-D-aspartate/D-glutamate deacylase